MVHREAEWDDYTRAEALAVVYDDARTCPSCGMRDSLVPVPEQARGWGWHDGRVVQVEATRCLGCGARDTIQRDFDESVKDHKNEPGKHAPGDGLRFHVREIREG